MGLAMVSVAKDIVEKEFISLSREASCLDAARAMKAKKHGYVIVSSSRGVPEGMVTEWDFLAKVIAEGRDPARVRLEEIMTSELVSVDAKTGLDEVAQLMALKGIRRVLVLEDDTVLGVITAATMLRRMKEYVDKISSQIARLHSPMM
jgi:signal-transduction protein with cAMP-binding, CBS, and nucleotidyltransferase domain